MESIRILRENHRIAVICCILPLALVWLLVFAPFWALGIGMTILLLVPSLLQYRCQKELDVFAPHVVLNLFLFLAFVLKPIWVATSGLFGPTYDKVPIIGEISITVLFAGLTALLGIGAWTIGYLFSGAQYSPRQLSGSISGKGIGFTRSTIVQLITLSISLYVLWWLADSLSPANRFEVFHNRGYLIVFLEFGKVGFFLWTVAMLLARTNSMRILFRPVWGIVFFILTSIDLYLGLRSALLLFNILIIAVLMHYHVKPLKPTVFFSVLAVLIVLFLMYRAVTRDVFDPRFRQVDPMKLITQNLTNPLDALMGGVEVGQFDSLVLAVEAVPRMIPYQYGKTLAAAAFYPVPRAIYPDKPDGAAVTFTDTLFPEYSGGFGVRIAISLITELYINGGILAVLCGMAIAGYACGAMYVRRWRKGVLSILWYGVFLGASVIGLRGDFLNGVVDFLNIGVPLAIFQLMVVKRSQINQE